MRQFTDRGTDMDARTHGAIAGMDWEELARRLESPEGSKKARASGEALDAYFGGEEYRYLRKLAKRAGAARSRGTAVGNVLLVPGIMGSGLLTSDRRGDRDLVWINVFRLALGQFKRLKLSSYGVSEADPEWTVRIGEVDKRTYARALLWLRASWNVAPFPFDWRKDMDVASDALSDFIRERYPGEPVHLVAHSMGGLVCRNFIRRHREQWDSLRVGERGGRLIMLGTPNYGSFAIPQTMTGDENLVRLLAAADLGHGLSDILGVVHSFVGSYEMLPAPSRLPPSLQFLYRAESWGRHGVSERHLERAARFHQELEQGDTIDPARMVYIAGCNQLTLSGMKMAGPGEFDYAVTDDGDGRVPHALGLLPGVPTFYVEASHDDLPRNEQVLLALQELLENGRTDILSPSPTIARPLPHGGLRRGSRIAEQRSCDWLREIGVRVRDGERCSSEEVRFAEETILRAAMGKGKTRPIPASRKVGRGRSSRMKPIPLGIELVRGDVTRVKAPVVVVGHYRGIPPVNAEGAIDKAMGFWISRAVRQGMIGAGLGELFFIPAAGSRIAADAVLLAGMGNAGEFGGPDLRYLITNVVCAVSALGHDAFAAVLIGSGEGNLSKERALRGLIEGLTDALRRLPPKERIRRLILVERDAAAYATISESLDRLARDRAIPGIALEIKLKRGKPSIPGVAKQRPPDIPEDAFPETRITVEREGERFRFSALSRTAVVPVREIELQSRFARDIAGRLISSTTLEEQSVYGRMLATYLIPEDFRRLVEDAESLTLILDRSTASLPWEMAGFKAARGTVTAGPWPETAQGTVFFGPFLRLTRQFRTMLGSPGLTPQLGRSVKALIIADPAFEPELRLPGARREGRAVADALNRFRQEGGLDIAVDEHIGANECDPVDILALLFDEEFDIVHYAGHAVFDEKHPSRGGWVFGRDCILSAREIFQTRRIPKLVFANACCSATIGERRAMDASEMNRSLAGMVEAFFERGIQNYIGAGWPVDDLSAARFASVFYEGGLGGKTIGEALAEARYAIMNQGSTWGAYQHYGQPNARLIL